MQDQEEREEAQIEQPKIDDADADREDGQEDEDNQQNATSKPGVIREPAAPSPEDVVQANDPHADPYEGLPYRISMWRGKKLNYECRQCAYKTVLGLEDIMAHIKKVHEPVAIPSGLVDGQGRPLAIES